MKNNIENILFLKKGESLTHVAKKAVSLHCHTLHSKEMLDFVPHYATRIPIASFFWRRHMKHSQRLYGRVPDFSKGHWTPPLTGQEVIRSEQNNLAKLGLESIVSITDHDSIDASLEILRDGCGDEVLVSMEWTVPFDIGFFHIGVHNLPRERAEAIAAELIGYTNAEGKPGNDRLHDLFKMLNELPSTLVVLNHPIWDIEMIGQQNHERLLAKFVAEYGKWIHAIEINGFRSWAENCEAAKLAKSLGLPLISGGDRHCLQANTMINATDAATFAEFAEEIRKDRRSFIAVTPEYNDPLPSRQLRSIAQILGKYDHFPEGRQTWPDRVYMEYNNGSGLKTLGEHWNGQIPKWTYPVFFALALLSHRAVQPVIALIVGDNDIGRNEEKTPMESFAIGNSPLSAER